MVKSIYQFKVKGIRGERIDFADFKGKKILIVNTASECGYTPQYQQLQELSTHFKDTLIIVGFPSNDFGGQEPGSEAEIQEFCERRFGVRFPLTEKIQIKGPEPHPVYQWLSETAEDRQLESEVKWNFHKFLIDENGQLTHSFPSAIGPLSDDILAAIQ